MPAKRVSLKGKGADLFFGGSQPSATDPPTDASPTGQAPADTPDAAPTARDIPAAPAAAILAGDGSTAAEAAPLPDGSTAPETTGAAAIAGESAGYRASMLASNDDLIETIRRVVRQTGREVSFVRLSAEEKGRLADIVYTYRRQGRKTTENELNRIAINALLEDYDAHGAQSVLARVLDALHS